MSPLIGILSESQNPTTKGSVLDTQRRNYSKSYVSNDGYLGFQEDRSREPTIKDPLGNHPARTKITSIVRDFQQTIPIHAGRHCHSKDVVHTTRTSDTCCMNNIFSMASTHHVCDVREEEYSVRVEGFTSYLTSATIESGEHHTAPHLEDAHHDTRVPTRDHPDRDNSEQGSMCVQHAHRRRTVRHGDRYEPWTHQSGTHKQRSTVSAER
jgi:hypothetical protein